jgi:hypothetical protein
MVVAKASEYPAMIQPVIPLLTPGNDRTISGKATFETVTFTVPRTNANDPVARDK